MAKSSKDRPKVELRGVNIKKSIVRNLQYLDEDDALQVIFDVRNYCNKFIAKIDSPDHILSGFL